MRFTIIDALNVKKRKEEILKLIGELKATHVAPAPSAKFTTGQGRREPALSGTLPRPKLVDAFERESPEKSSADAGVSQRFAEIEGRLSKVEETLARGVFRPATGRPGRMSLFSPPIVPVEKEGAAAVEASARLHTLSGLLREGVLADIIQYLSSGGVTGVLDVESQTDPIRIYLRDGELFAAHCGNLTGQNAFFAAMSVSEGSFTFDESTDLPSEKNLDGSTQLLILEGLRQADEGRVSDEDRAREAKK